MTEREAQALRDEFAGLSKKIRAAYRQGYADGVYDERAAVVAWLRDWARPLAGYYDMSVRKSVLLEASDRIERGEHRREGEP